jgi:hypothetical protein
VSRLGKRTNALRNLLWNSLQMFLSDGIAKREDGSQGNEFGDLIRGAG